MREWQGHYLVRDEQFMENLGSVDLEDYSRDSKISPTDLMFDFIAASVKKWQPGAKELKRQYLELVAPDAQYYGLTPEELFGIHLEALDEAYSSAEFPPN